MVFASQKGTVLRPENILKRIIHPTCEKLGLPKVGWHDLRHTSATLLHQHEPLRVTQAILGHSDLQTTLGYTHVLPGWQRDAIKRLETVVLFPKCSQIGDGIRNARFGTRWGARYLSGAPKGTTLELFSENLCQVCRRLSSPLA
ncbi:MAG: tyrosine-type recombinase/integrase [Candidatus Acidiferrales bacterium]